MASNRDLAKAQQAKKDEFYTQLSDIEKEMKYYQEQFKDKVIFCNCDDPVDSNFWKYFELNFTKLGLKRLISTHYETDKPSYMLEINRDENGDGLITSKDIVKTKLKQNGDFRSPECIELLKQADIVITNPPFSLFREYVAQLMEYDKKFIIIGNVNAITYKEFFPLIKDNKVWLGASIHSGDREFKIPNDYPLNASGFRVDELGNKYIRVKGVRWWTNLDYPQRHEDLILYKTYNAEEYPKFDNYDAINVDKTSDIPVDYDGVMGVPITFLDKYNPDQFKIITMSTMSGKSANYWSMIGGKSKYSRVFIIRRDSSKLVNEEVIDNGN
ncbi:MAG: adenine-specific methyltransferase EcoRI family protein [Clostridia bacterium]|nr:adenine-specific methyltransferase EcoRI family protein [Clostridia bacterium]